MRVLISLHHRFKMAPDGTVYPYSVFDYKFWCRYLEVYDEVVVFARVEKIGQVDPRKMPAQSSGPGVRFLPFAHFAGAWEHLKAYSKIKALAKDLLKEPYACILRVPSTIAAILWKELIKLGHPYGVEVLGDPWDGLSPGTYRNTLRPAFRIVFPWVMHRQCRDAAVASYVTQYSLQKRYPPGAWSTYYSSIELPASAIADESTIQKRLKNIDTKSQSGSPWRIGYAGSLWHLGKAPDILISSVADCINKGLKLELVVLGKGEYQPQLEEQAKRLGITEHVKFLGKLPPGQAVLEQLDMCDLYALPSRQEGLPRSAIEAMARGLPCVTSNVGGFPELTESKYMVIPNDIQGLSQKIAMMVSDPEGMKKAIKRNVKKAAEYRTDILQKRRVELYTRLRDITQKWLDSK